MYDTTIYACVQLFVAAAYNKLQILHSIGNGDICMRLGYRRRKYIIKLAAPASKKINIILIIILIVAVVCSTSVFFATAIRPVMLAYSKAYAHNMAVNMINKSVSEHFIKTDIKYDDLIILQKNENGDIIAIQADIVGINKLKSEISLSLQNMASQQYEGKLRIPLGSIFKTDLFSGVGPRVPVKVNILDFTDVDIESVFLSEGINQTKHQIFLTVKLSIMIYLPGIQKGETVSTKVPVAETVIVGTVPNTYTNIVDSSKSAKDIALDITHD